MEVHNQMINKAEQIESTPAEAAKRTEPITTFTYNIEQPKDVGEDNTTVSYTFDINMPETEESQDYWSTEPEDSDVYATAPGGLGEAPNVPQIATPQNPKDLMRMLQMAAASGAPVSVAGGTPDPGYVGWRAYGENAGYLAKLQDELGAPGPDADDADVGGDVEDPENLEDILAGEDNDNQRAILLQAHRERLEAIKAYFAPEREQEVVPRNKFVEAPDIYSEFETLGRLKKKTADLAEVQTYIDNCVANGRYMTASELADVHMRGESALHWRLGFGNPGYDLLNMPKTAAELVRMDAAFKIAGDYWAKTGESGKLRKTYNNITKAIEAVDKKLAQYENSEAEDE